EHNVPPVGFGARARSSRAFSRHMSRRKIVMGWSRRPVVVAAATSVLTLVAAACGGGGDSGGAGGGDKQLTFVSWGGGYQEAQEDLIVKPWGEKNGVRI